MSGDLTHCAMCGSATLIIRGVFVDYDAGTCRWRVACANGHELSPYPGTEITVRFGEDREPERLPWMVRPPAPGHDG